MSTHQLLQHMPKTKQKMAFDAMPYNLNREFELDWYPALPHSCLLSWQV